MPDDWSWFFASEYGRDRMLRTELEGLQSRASAASAQSARLSSQLRTLQGSIESRLQALSAAFDAYVELGDVREQLAGYPDTGAIRRDALRALDTLHQGGTPDRVDGRGIDYWLVDAVNEVMALVGHTEPAPAASASGSPGPEYETFVVATLGWLGRGEQVSGRVVPLLLGDGALAAAQVVLWQAVVHGLFGDVMEAVHAEWSRDLDLSPATWDRFARETADAAAPVDTLRWVADLLRGDWTPPARRADAGPPVDDHLALRRLVDALVGAGLGDERVLLERARVLRARIEDPGRRLPDPDTEPPRTGTTDLVQQALLDPAVPAALRSALVGWVRPGLQAASAEIAAQVASDQPDPTVVRTETGDVEVGTDGADPGRLAQVDALAVQRFATPRSRVLVPGVAAGAVLVVGLVLLLTHHSGLGVLLLVVAGVLGVVLTRALLAARTARAELAASRQRTRQRVEEGRATAVAVRSASLETKAEVASLARAVAAVGQPQPSTSR